VGVNFGSREMYSTKRKRPMAKYKRRRQNNDIIIIIIIRIVCLRNICVNTLHKGDSDDDGNNNNNNNNKLKVPGIQMLRSMIKSIIIIIIIIIGVKLDNENLYKHCSRPFRVRPRKQASLKCKGFI
jgi:hypothetical protein